MTGKLIKYEIKSSIRLISAIWAGIIFISIILFLLEKPFVDLLSDYMIYGFIVDAAMFLYGALIFAMVVINIMIIIISFYKGLLGDEGYLMHTLPVKPWQLITSKGIVSAGIVTVSLLVGILSAFILDGFTEFDTVIQFFNELDGESVFFIVLMIIEAIVAVVLSIVKFIYQVYASLSIGQLVNKHRILLSFGAYVGINTVLSILGLILIIGFYASGSIQWLDNMFTYLNYENIHMMQILFAIIFGITAVQIVAFHIISERLLSKKLNLQ